MLQPRSRPGLIDMRATGGPQFPPLAFLWPALAAETASEFASAMAREFISLAVGPGTETGAPEPQFATRNKVVLELVTVRLRRFARPRGSPSPAAVPGRDRIGRLSEAGSPLSRV